MSEVVAGKKAHPVERKVDDFLEAVPAELRTIVSVGLFVHKSPELIAMGWEKFTVQQVAAFSELIAFATASGLTYELKHVEADGSMPAYFGLEIPGKPEQDASGSEVST